MKNAATESKSLALLRILDILREYSDADHLLSAREISNILNRDYGIEINDLRTIKSKIAILEDAGYEIEGDSNDMYLSTRILEDSELRLFIDSVVSNNNISEEYSKEIVDSLSNIGSKNFKKRVKHINSIRFWNKGHNKQLFNTIDVLDEAIEKNKRVKFIYNAYGVDKKLRPRAKSKYESFSPYQMIIKNQKYYVFGFNGKDEKVGKTLNLRIDRITDIAILEDTAIELNKIKGYENGIDYEKFSDFMPYMYDDEPVRVEMITNEKTIDQIIDWFGLKNTRIWKDKDETIHASVKVSPLAMAHWAKQYLENVEIVEPKELREKIKSQLEDGLKKYK